MTSYVQWILRFLPSQCVGKGPEGRREFGTEKKNKFELKTKDVLAYLYQHNKLLATS